MLGNWPDWMTSRIASEYLAARHGVHAITKRFAVTAVRVSAPSSNIAASFPFTPLKPSINGWPGVPRGSSAPRRRRKLQGLRTAA